MMANGGQLYPMVPDSLAPGLALKIPFGSNRVRVRPPPPAPFRSELRGCACSVLLLAKGSAPNIRFELSPHGDPSRAPVAKPRGDARWSLPSPTLDSLARQWPAPAGDR